MMSASIRIVRKFVWLGFLLSVLFLASCGGGSSTSGAPISITLSGPASSISVGEAVTIEATVYDPNKQGVTWTLSPATFGTLSAGTATAVTYTAPAQITQTGKATIIATSITNPTITASVEIIVSPVLVSLTNTFGLALAPFTLNQGAQTTMVATVTPSGPHGVTWSLSPATGAGTLQATFASQALYTAPSTVSSQTAVTVTATSVDTPTASASVTIYVLPSGAGPNVVPVSVNGGQVPGQTYANGAFTSILICQPGSTVACQVVDGILVDSGSVGLRILQSAVPMLKFHTITDGIGNTLENCQSLANGAYRWGAVSSADVYIGGEVALTLPFQLIPTADAVVPDGCTNGGVQNSNTPQLLGANGILGIGLEPTDCTLAGTNYCDGSTNATLPNLYYSCAPLAGCATTDSPVIATTASRQQVTNPITLFADNTGSILQLPVPAGPGATVNGLLIFGINTQINNLLGNATILTLDANDHFTTTFQGQNLVSSFIDSGANGLFFPDSLPVCTSDSQFFCPGSLTNLTATDQGATQGSAVVNFSVDNADRLFSMYPGGAAFDTLAGPEQSMPACVGGGTSCSFDWGLPFFYGRSVFTKIDACTPPPAMCMGTSGAWYAF